MTNNSKASAYVGNHAGLIAALSYGLISIAITLFNKAVLSTYGFNSTMTLTLLQGVVTLVCLEVMKWKGYIDFPSFNFDTARKVAPLSFVFIAYVVVSLVSLGRVNVPMFTALRRLTILFVMVEEYLFLGVTPSRKVLYTVALMTLGAVIAAAKDLTFDPVSYGYLFLTNLFTSLYTVFINKVKKDTGLGVFAMLYYNNATTLPFLAGIAWYTGDLSRAWSFKYSRDVFFQMNFQASVFLAFLLNLSTFYCTTLNSARTQTVVGQIKNFFAFILGLVLFDDYIYERWNFAGLLVGFAGSVWYTYVTSREKSGPPPAGGAGGKGAEGSSSNSKGKGPSGEGATAIALPDRGGAGGYIGKDSSADTQQDPEGGGDAESGEQQGLLGSPNAAVRERRSNSQ